MSRVLLIAAIVLMIGTAVLAFLTKGQKVALKSELDSTKLTLTSTKVQLKQTQDDLTATKGELASTKTTLESREKDLASTKDKLQTAENDAKQVRESLATKEAELAKIKEDLQKFMGAPGGEKVDLEGMKLALEKAKTEAQEKTTLLEATTGKVKNLEGEVTGYKQKEVERQAKLMKPGLEGMVMAVNQGWNFVVLNIGDKQGVNMNSEMIVKRDGNRVATVKITSVEPNTAVADIVPGSIARGVKVQPGDKVIFEKGS